MPSQEEIQENMGKCRVLGTEINVAVIFSEHEDEEFRWSFYLPGGTYIGKVTGNNNEDDHYLYAYPIGADDDEEFEYTSYGIERAWEWVIGTYCTANFKEETT